MKKIVSMIIIGTMILQTLSIIGCSVIGEEIEANHREKLKNIVSGEIIVKFKPEYSENKFAKFFSDHGVSVHHRSRSSSFHLLKAPENKYSEIINIFSKNPNIEFVEPNYIAQVCMSPNDPYYNYQWHLHDINEGGIDMEPAWDISTGSGAVVAVIDTGISIGTDLEDTCFVNGYDFVNNDNDPTDDNGHGTHVAGTVAQSTNNNLGVCGVAYNACLMPVKVLDQDGYGTYADIIDGIVFAVDNGADIISMSFGGSSYSQALEEAVAYAYNSGVTCVAASGNGYGNGIDYPAAYDDYVIAVGATQYDKTRAPYSDYGNSLDVVAPGGNIMLDQNGDGYADGVLQQTFDPNWVYSFWQGTSMATPHVSGTAALLYSDGVTSPDDIRNYLESSAVDLGSDGWDIYYGYGLINAYYALTYTPGDNPPTCSITSPDNGATVSGDVTIEVSATDDNGVTKVDFYVESTFLGSDTSQPYSWLWDSTTVEDDTYTITATAYDTASQSTSDLIDVIVDNVYDPSNEEFYDSFEVSEWNGLWVEDSQNDWFRSTQRSTDGSYSAEVDGRATDATLTLFDSIDLSDKSGAELTFSWFIENSWDAGEYIALDVYDGSWHEIISLDGNSDPENTWHHETVNLGSYLVSGFKIRFRARVSSSFEDGNVDNVKIVSYGGQPNTPPDAPTNPVPTDGATDIDTNPTLSVDVYDADSDNMDVTFYDANDGVIGIDTNVPSGGTASVVWSELDYETTYNWYTVADDGTDSTQSTTWSFTTENAPQNNPPNVPINPVPADGATDIDTNPTLSVDVYDADSDNMDVTFFDANDGVIGIDTNVPSGGTASVVWSELDYETTYNWYTVADDGTDSTQSATWSFTTENAPQNNPPDIPINPVPTDGAIDIGISPTLNVDVNDADGDTMTVYFYEQSGSLIGIDTVVGSGTAITSWTNANEYSTTYYWYTVADDGTDQTTSSMWSFTTEDEPSETVEFYDSFEVGEWNGLWTQDDQNDWFRSSRRAYDGSYSAEVDGYANNAELVLANPIDLSGKTTAILTFSWFIERSWDTGEYIALDVYDGSWHEEAIIRGNVDQEDVWHQVTVDLSSYMDSNFQIRFRANVSRSNEDGHVDDVKIISYL